MMTRCMLVLRQTALTIGVFAALTGWPSGPAQARFFVGVGVPFYGPNFYPPPVYYPPPPVYYAPPPVFYAPPPPVFYQQPPIQTYTPAPATSAAGAGQACFAGAYTCPAERPMASGASCYCQGNAGQKVWGRAN